MYKKLEKKFIIIQWKKIRYVTNYFESKKIAIVIHSGYKYL